MSIFDYSTNSEKACIQVKIDESKPQILQQNNKVIVSESQKLIITGSEDNLIRLYDLNSLKPIKSIVAHTDSVTSLLLAQKSNHSMMLSGGHDGAVRAWDIRTF